MAPAAKSAIVDCLVRWRDESRIWPSGHRSLDQANQLRRLWIRLWFSKDSTNQPQSINQSICQLGIEASTSMYSLSFCVRVMLPERHQWKPAVQAATVMLTTPPSTASHRPASHADFPYTARNFENAPVTRRSPASRARTLRRAFALCHHIAGWTQACN